MRLWQDGCRHSPSSRRVFVRTVFGRDRRKEIGERGFLEPHGSVDLGDGRSDLNILGLDHTEQRALNFFKDFGANKLRLRFI